MCRTRQMWAGAARLHLRYRPQIELPSLGGKILPEAVMLFFAHDLEPCLFVDVSRRMKNALRPKGHLPIPRLPCESDAFLNQPLADSEPPRLRFHMEQAQLCDFVGCLCDEDGTNPCSIPFRNPAAFALRIVLPDKLPHNFGRQRFEGFIPSVFLCIKNSLPMYDPAHVARPVLSQQIGSFWLRFVAEQPSDRLHCVNQLLPLQRREFFKHCGHVAIRTLIKRRKGAPPLSGQ